jgi:hypothetical protein
MPGTPTSRRAIFDQRTGFLLTMAFAFALIFAGAWTLAGWPAVCLAYGGALMFASGIDQSILAIKGGPNGG